MTTTMDPAMSTLLSGDEAIARGAFEAGVRVATAYPGTPSTEILEVRAPWRLGRPTNGGGGGGGGGPHGRGREPWFR